MDMEISKESNRMKSIDMSTRLAAAAVNQSRMTPSTQMTLNNTPYNLKTVNTRRRMEMRYKSVSDLD